MCRVGTFSTPSCWVLQLAKFAEMSSSVPRIVGEAEVARTRWLRLSTLTYLDQEGKSRKWDVASRTTKQSGGVSDAVAILALLRHPDRPTEPELLLVNQWRPPVRATTIELPAGLIDAGESATDAALRELKEETGYRGVNASASGVLAMSPGLTDETITMVKVEVDLGDPANQNPVQHLDDAECIRVRRVPVRNLLATIGEMEREGMVAFAGLHMLALGLSMAT